MKRTAHYILVVAFFTLQVAAQPASNVNKKELDDYFAQMQTDWNIPSIAIGVVKDGELVYSETFGVKEEGKKQKPDEHTLYAIASNSKAFTATLIAMLVEEGKLSWKDKVVDYLPYFKVYDSWVSKEMTIEDLLSHRSGLGTFSGDIMWYKSGLSSEEIIKKTLHLPKAFDFRAGFGYSNIMYITAGELIKIITGKTWGENVQERILDPLGMSRTIYSPLLLDSKGNYATPHSLRNEQNIPINWVDWEEVAALGGLISSVSDVSKWMIFNMNGGIWESDTLITKSSLSKLWTPFNNFYVNKFSDDPAKMHFRGYGLGWGLSDYYGNLKVAHTGGYDGMITAVTMIPDQNLGVVVLTNGLNSPIRAATNYALDKFLGVETKDWSKELLEKTMARKKSDTRIENMKNSRIENTVPSLPLEGYVGTFISDIHGKINVELVDDELKLSFEHSHELSATLKHWHFDIWELDWDHEHAWFSFGTVGFIMNNQLEIKGLEFDVPNNDIFFYELKPYKVK